MATRNDWRQGDSVITPATPTASEITLGSGGRAGGGSKEKYNPFDSDRGEQTQPVMPGQTGYINQRKPAIRPSANMAPKPSAVDAKNQVNETGSRSSGTYQRPMVKGLLEGLQGRKVGDRAGGGGSRRTSDPREFTQPTNRMTANMEANPAAESTQPVTPRGGGASETTQPIRGGGGGGGGGSRSGIRSQNDQLIKSDRMRQTSGR